MLISIQYSIRLLHFPCIFTLTFVHLNSVPFRKVEINSHLWLPNYVVRAQSDVEEKNLLLHSSNNHSKWRTCYRMEPLKMYLNLTTDDYDLKKKKIISATNVWRSLKNKLCRFDHRTSVKEIHSIDWHEMVTGNDQRRKNEIK